MATLQMATAVTLNAKLKQASRAPMLYVRRVFAPREFAETATLLVAKPTCTISVTTAICNLVTDVVQSVKSSVDFTVLEEISRGLTLAKLSVVMGSGLAMKRVTTAMPTRMMDVISV